MKIFVVVLAFLCLKETTAFFSVKVSGVTLEADFKTSCTNISTNINATLKSLTDLTTQITLQAAKPQSDVLFVRNTTDVIYSYLQLMAILNGDFLRFNSDSSYTIPRIFMALSTDSTVIGNFISSNMPEAAGAAIDAMFSTKLQVSIAAIDSALISMASELQGFAGAFVLFQGTLAPITAALVSNAFNGTNISNIKIAIGSIDLNIAVIRQQVADLLLIIQAENALVTALAKPIGQYAVSLITGCANILTEAKKQVMIATKSQIASTLIVNTTISAFTTKFQATYSETIVAPIISATIQTCDGYSFNIGNNLDTIVSGFDSLVFRYLDPKAEAPLFLNGSYSQLAVISDNATTFQEYLLSALTINTPLARSCVAKFAPQAVSILTATSTQFDGCVKLAIAFFQNEEKAVENNLNAVRTKALNYIASMTSCMTPATGTAFDRGVVVNCIQALNSALIADTTNGQGTSKYAIDAVNKYYADTNAAQDSYLSCLATAASVQERSIITFYAAFELCQPLPRP